MKKIVSAIRGILLQIIKNNDLGRIQKKEFVVISNNCFGAEIYKWVEKPYNTPFIGLFLHGDCYIKLLQDFDNIIEKKLVFINVSKYNNLSLSTYPIACFEGTSIEIHFMHYKSKEEAEEKWQRRLSRMLKISNKSNYYFKICDRDGGTLDILQEFHQLSFPNKISFSINSLPSISNGHICVNEKNNSQQVPDGIALYQLSHKYVDLIKWIEFGLIQKNIKSTLKYYFRIY